MKKAFYLGLLLISISAYSADIIVLKNHSRFTGTIVKIKNCDVYFKVDVDTYKIPSEDIEFVQFEDVNNPIYTNYAQDNKCFKGSEDARNYHGKVGGHLVLGFLFGPFATIGAAVASPNPYNGANTLAQSQNKELYSDPEYLQCYKKTARGRNAGNTLIGWGIWLIIYAAATS